MIYEYNFLIKDSPLLHHEDLSVLFDEEDVFKFIDANIIMADILVIVGIYSSKSKAKKDGWNNPIPSGWYDNFIGKKRIRISIWNPNK